jgi:hypothetical protein
MNRYISILVVVMAFVGCTSTRISQNLSSGVIGCKPEEIAILNETATAIGSMHNWEALCKGKHFICSYQPTTGVNCKEAIQSKEEPSLDKDGRFIANNDGTVLDTGTGLMWAAKDNGADIEWQDAKSYCEHYRGGGYTDWRMPTQDELAGLYDAAKIYQVSCGDVVHITKLIHLTCSWVWASTTSSNFFGSPRVADFDFSQGGRYWHHPKQSLAYRALPVRSGKYLVTKSPEKQSQPPIENAKPFVDAGQRNKGIKGIVLTNGNVVEGQILSWDPDTVKIRTKEGKILSYDFKKEVQRFIIE